MTIKEFASLCGCSTQTLRYYDKIGLLKPVKVDRSTGYRYYAKAQAIDFVKIKNLQAADFTIDEIRPLLELSDWQVYEAFERKIAEQLQKLERIKQIQRSYLTEKENMERLVKSITDYLLHTVSDYEVLREFGLSPDEGAAAVERMRAYLERTTMDDLSKMREVSMTLNGRVISGAEQVAETFETLKGNGYDDTVLLGCDSGAEEAEITPENSQLIWERHGWEFVYEFIEQIPALEPGYRYGFDFQLEENKYQERLEFPIFMIAAMLTRTGADKIAMGCSVKRSTDRTNHFALLRRV